MESSEALAALHALAQPSRLHAFKLLVRAGADGMRAGDIAEAVGAPASTMSAHLATLLRSGLIAQQRQSREIYYSLDADGVRALFGFLAGDCCGGRPELCAPLASFTSECKPARKSRARNR